MAEYATINYYARKQFYHHIIIYCDDTLKQKISDPTLQFWRAFGILMEGQVTDAMRDFMAIQEKRDLLLVAPSALIYAHGKCGSSGIYPLSACSIILLLDSLAIEELQAKLTVSSSKILTEKAYLNVTLFHWHTGNIELAKDYIKQLSRAIPSNNVSDLYSAWIGLQSAQHNSVSDCSKLFEKILEKSPKDIDALLGKLECLKSLKKQPDIALDIISQLMVQYSDFVPAYIERVYVLLDFQGFDQAVEAANRLLAIYPESIDAFAILSIHELCNEGGSKMAVSHITGLYKAIENTEPKNWNVFLYYAKPLIRLSGRNSAVLEKCLKFVESANRLKPNHGDITSEKAYIKFLQGNIPKAKEYYQKSSELDPNNIRAVEGIIRCQIHSGDYKNAEEQLELFNQMAQGVAIFKDRMNVISYLSSLLVWVKNKDSEKRKKYLKEAVAYQMGLIKNTPVNIEYFIKINSEFMLEIIRDFAEYCPTEHMGGSSSIISSSLIKFVEAIHNTIPGSLEIAFYLAKFKYLVDDQSAAQEICTACLKIDPAFSKAHILMAQIYLRMEQYKLALQSLEMGMSYNFDVRHMSLFHIVKSKALNKLEMYQDALSSIKLALDQKEAGTLPVEFTASLADKVTLYLDMVEAHSHLGNIDEAEKVMKEAMSLFSGTAEDGKIIISNALLFVEKGDIDLAIQTWNSITEEQSYFTLAKTQVAEIYKKYKRDLRVYARCYSELVAHNPSTHTYLLLGDAYMAINEPEKAIAIYEKALGKDQKNHVLSMKIGKALVKIHDFGKAIKYYENALAKDPTDSFSLRYDLAELYFKLKKVDEVEKTVFGGLKNSKSVDYDRNTASQDVALYTILSKAYKKGKNESNAIKYFQRAKELQANISMREPNTENKVILSAILLELAELHLNSSKEKAESYYKESIAANSKNGKAIIALCKLHIANGNLSEAQKHCTDMIKNEVCVEEATMLIADIMLKNNSLPSAIFHFQQLIDKNPLNFNALLQLIEIMRREGRLAEINAIVDNVQKSSSTSQLQAGFHFCKGKMFRYMNNPNQSLKEFNYCRNDKEWGTEAIYSMIEIFLNPHNEIVGGEVLMAGEDRNDSEILAMATSDKLLIDVPQNCSRTKVLKYRTMMASKQKTDIESALNLFMDLLVEEPDNVSALLGSAVAHMLQKKPPKARNQLKRLAKMEWSPEIAEDLENGWILLADIYTTGGKYDLATELLKKVLLYNKSNSRAWEYLGFIMEKEASYKDAAEYYEKVWKMENNLNPAMGYKLAFNYLKAKRFVDAIDVAHKILKTTPDYPKIRKEILEKARAGIRVPAH